MDTSDANVVSFRKFITDSIQKGKKLTILALVGSGLSVASGIQTYNTAEDGNLWRNFSVIDLATLDAFDANPGLVWLFYALRRHNALNSEPNNGHRLLAKLSNLDKYFNFLTITQNLDGLHQRAHHNPDKLLEFHGSLFQQRCTNFFCNYSSAVYDDPLTSALDSTKYEKSDSPLPKITSLDQLPLCPVCGNESPSLLRPGVVFFGESLPLYLIDKADEFIIENNIDLLLVIGTSHSVWPTASYIDIVKNQGGKIAVFNTVTDTEIEKYARNTDVWQFIGDCSVTLPEIFNPLLASLESESSER